MISIGIDVSKEKSTVCILRPYGEVVKKPFEINHDEKDLSELSRMILKFDDEVRVVLEATGIYHLPVLTYLQDQGIFVAVINPYEMKKYRYQGLRRVKTDKHDSIGISNYGIDHWYHLKNYEPNEQIYEELKLLGRKYSHYMTLRIASVQDLFHLLDYAMPGINKLLGGWREKDGKDKLSDFVEIFWHYDNITKLSEEGFIEEYKNWTKKAEYNYSLNKAQKIYSLALKSIPTLPSNTETTKMLVQESVKVLRQIDATLKIIISKMKELAKTLPEYSVVREMGGVGDVLASKLIAEIGDVRRFHSAKALVAYAGIDAPPYQSGQFIGTHRKISKRGSTLLRKIGYEVMTCLKTSPGLSEDKVYQFIIKKEKEGKAKKLAKIAGLNKFLHIYYARVNEVYK